MVFRVSVCVVFSTTLSISFSLLFSFLFSISISLLNPVSTGKGAVVGEKRENELGNRSGKERDEGIPK